MKLERLYKTAKTGSTQIFDIEVTGNTFKVTWGKLGGKLQEKVTTCEAKNVGRSNELTPEEQALVEAKAVWIKKQKANYSTSIKAPVTVNLPMKVNKYQDHWKKVTFPCFISPKLNGVNCEYRLVEGDLVLLSRGGETYPIPEHQVEEVKIAMKHFETTSLNGEMYIHGEHLQDIMAATKKHNELTPRLIFYIFDLPLVEITYKSKVPVLDDFNHTSTCEFVKSIDIVPAHSHDEIEVGHALYVSNGYEGLIVRNAKTKYKYNTRSLDVFKFKTTKDAEFKITGYNIDKNGHAVFICDTGFDSSFKVKMKGTNEQRLEIAANADDFMDSYVKIEYEMLSKDNVPLKPVGIMLRSVDENGEAIE